MNHIALSYLTFFQKSKFKLKNHIKTTFPLKYLICRAKKANDQTLPARVPKTWTELDAIGIPASVKTAENGTPFLRFFGPIQEGEEKKMMIFATDRGLSILKNSTIIGMDGTFYRKI